MSASGEEKLSIQLHCMPSGPCHSDFDPSDEFFNASKFASKLPEVEVVFSPPDIGSSKETILFFDMDNCLYPKSSGISESVRKRILLFCSHVHNMTEEEALFLGKKYHTDYGLAIKGLLLHHPGTDPSQYDKIVDGGIDIKASLADHSSSKMRGLFENIKKSNKNQRIWILTNAGLSHSLRTLSFLFDASLRQKGQSLEMLPETRWFDGIVYCDYSVPDFLCKPQVALFKAVEHMTETTAQLQPILIDDSLANIFGALKAGWKAVLVSEQAPSEHVFLENSGKFMRFISYDFYCFAVVRNVYDIEKVLPFVA